MKSYEDQALIDLQFWQYRMKKAPSLTNRVSKNIQNKLNNLIPEKIHQGITLTIEKMVKGVLFGAQYTTGTQTYPAATLQLRESLIRQQIEFYQKTATVEGALTGAGGILLGLADFPLLLSIKIKLLFDMASLYGFDVKDYKERLYILYVFQLTFSSQQRRSEIFSLLENWDSFSKNLPENSEEFNWRTFQQEYRDYIDLAKMAQLLPVIGAVVGAVANYKLMASLGETGMNCYRMRLFMVSGLLPSS
jgi:uncharacterized protein (DUF697 family)